MKRIAILGSTGSIGRNTVDVAAAHRGEFAVGALAVRTNARAGLAQAIALECPVLAVESEEAASGIAAEAAAAGVEIYAGPDAAERAAAAPGIDMVLVALVGLSGLKPVLAAIEAGRDVALATKEVLVAAGALVMAKAAKRGVRMIPVDSEHSAIFQCIQERSGESANFPAGVLHAPASITLTASGGPFLREPADLSRATPEMALKHPRWDMGRKVTVDSATMMNKGFEMLEARWLFDVPVSRIGVVVHPQSIVHSLVTFEDGSTLAQLAPPDMRVPIQYALSWPRRLPARRKTLDLAACGRLEFFPADENRFPCLALARRAAEAGGTKAVALSAADEIAVERFLGGSISFTDIPELVAGAMENDEGGACDSFAAVFAADARARDFARKW